MKGLPVLSLRKSFFIMGFHVERKIAKFVFAVSVHQVQLFHQDILHQQLHQGQQHQSVKAG